MFHRLGLLFEPPGGVPFVKTHAALPVADAVGSHVRVYWSGRDPKGRARVASCDADLSRPGVVIRVSERPVLDLGPLAYNPHNPVTRGLVQQVVHVIATNHHSINPRQARDYVNKPLRYTTSYISPPHGVFHLTRRRLSARHVGWQE